LREITIPMMAKTVERNAVDLLLQKDRIMI
jgi:hypothetical protein